MKYILIFLLIIIQSCSSCLVFQDTKKTASIENTNYITLASWNIRYFSTGSRDDEELAVIASIIKRYDIIALQEVRDEEVIKRLIKIIPEYNYLISPAVGTIRQKEHYVYLYKSALLAPLGDAYIYPDPENNFIREPFVSSFRAAQFDFTLCNIHVLWGNSKAERREEIMLLDDVMVYVDKMNGPENDNILLGDFNFPADDHGWEMGDYTAAIPPGVATTIKGSSYDNFWFITYITEEYTGDYEVYNFDEILYNNDDNAASLAVSDHRPISITFYF